MCHALGESTINLHLFWNNPFVKNGAKKISDSPYSPYVKKLKLGEPADYRIKIQGHLDVSWSGRLGGMQIKAGNRGEKATVTELTGRVADQAQLIGVLNSLYELHLPILSVEIVPKKEDKTMRNKNRKPRGCNK